jgi:hypothetical protein
VVYFISVNSLAACPLCFRIPFPAALCVGNLGCDCDHERASIMSSDDSGAGHVYQSDNGDASIFSQTLVATWVLTVAAGAFLIVRLACRHRFSKLWWDDLVLSISWVRLGIGMGYVMRGNGRWVGTA